MPTKKSSVVKVTKMPKKKSTQKMQGGFLPLAAMLPAAAILAPTINAGLSPITGAIGTTIGNAIRWPFKKFLGLGAGIRRSGAGVLRSGDVFYSTAQPKPSFQAQQEKYGSGLKQANKIVRKPFY